MKSRESLDDNSGNDGHLEFLEVAGIRRVSRYRSVISPSSGRLLVPSLSSSFSSSSPAFIPPPSLLPRRVPFTGYSPDGNFPPVAHYRYLRPADHHQLISYRRPAPVLLLGAVLIFLIFFSRSLSPSPFLFSFLFGTTTSFFSVSLERPWS